MLTRDVNEGMFFGVCAGLARHMEVDVSLVRVIALVLFVASGTTISLLYLLAAIFMPKG